jgi:hypothetical protein
MADIGAKLLRLSQGFDILQDQIELAVQESRLRSLALTALEEAQLWAEKALHEEARIEKIRTDAISAALEKSKQP